MSFNSKRAAAPSFLGYLFQLGRALLWLSRSEESCSVFVETHDDVVIRLNDGISSKDIFEQDKLTLTSTNPFSDSNKNLWNSLNNWIELVETRDVNIDECLFLLCTNKKITTKKLLVKRISMAKEAKEIEEVYDLLLAKCQKEVKGKNSKKIKLFNPFIKLDKGKALKLIENIELIDGVTYSLKGKYFETIRNNLNIPKKSAVNAIYEELLGWVTNKVIDSWSQKQIAELKSEEFYLKYADVIARYNSAPFIELTKELMPLSAMTTKEHTDSLFVKELDKINVLDEEIIEAIEDYIAESIQRTNFAKNGFLTKRDWRYFDNSLEQKWKEIRRRTLNLGDFDSDEKKGYSIYADCMDYKGILADVQTMKNFTNRGTFHRLVNKSVLGWHPNWNK